MRLAVLYARMLRYRVSLILVFFMLAGALSGAAKQASVPRLAALVALLVSLYGLSTSLNDLADYEIDKINLAGHDDRPLVSGSAGRGSLWLIAGVNALAAFSLSAFLGPFFTGATLLAVALGAAYSLRPLEVSRRALVVPFYLSVGYCVLPFAMGYAAANGSLKGMNPLLLAGLYLLFVSRISLKDFRDRKGDSANGKRTILLARGKTFVCNLSFAAFAAGLAAVAVSLRAPLGVSLVFLAFLLPGAALHYRLRAAAALEGELLAIAVGAKFGNLLLASVLAYLILSGSNAPVEILIGGAAAPYAASCYAVLEFLRRPSEFTFNPPLPPGGNAPGYGTAAP